MTEPFTQWVIEDHFPAGRPAFETVGAQLVEDVEPFELMKLRMLNGSPLDHGLSRLSRRLPVCQRGHRRPRNPHS